MYILLFIFWIILNAKITLEVCLLGLGLTALIGVLQYILFKYTPRKDLRVLKKIPLFLAYIFVLLIEIVKANFSVMQLILHRNRKTSPTLVTFESGLKTDFGRFLLANSITLTPGTITVEINDDLFTVHCLSRTLLDTSPDSTFIRWIRRLEA